MSTINPTCPSCVEALQLSPMPFTSYRMHYFSFSKHTASLVATPGPKQTGPSIVACRAANCARVLFRTPVANLPSSFLFSMGHVPGCWLQPCRGTVQGL